MARTRRFSRSQIRAAIRGSRGIKITIAERLGCTRQTLDTYLATYPELQAEIEAERETIVDAAESKLMEAIQQGELRAVIFALETFGKGRGWSKRTELTGADGAPLGLPADVLAQLRELGVEPSDVVQQFVALIREQAEAKE